MMRNFKTAGENFSLDPVTTGGSGGGCITACFMERYNSPYENNIIETQLWRPRTSMNLIRLEVRADYWHGATDETRFYVYSYSVLGPIASVYIGESASHAFWTGAVSVDAGDFLSIGMDGCPYYGDLSISTLSVSAWFDGQAGGGLIFNVLLGE